MSGPTPPRADTPRLTLDEIRAQDLALDAASAAHPAGALKPGMLSPNRAAVTGVDGHMFVGDGANRWEAQFRGELTVPDAWLDGWTRIFKARAGMASGLGVTLCNVVLPEKQVVHAEARWPEGDVTGERRPLKLLQPRLGPEAALFYGAEVLLPRKADSAVWFRRNSHWSASGCCLVTEALARRLDAQADLAQVRYSYRVRPAQHDLTAHFFTKAPPEDAGFLDAGVETFFDNRLLQTTGRNTGASYGLRNPTAPDPRRVIVFGDSYSYDVGFTFALIEIFAEVVFVWQKTIDWGLVTQHQSQVVVWESAERFLATLPEA
jgi:alginate O-acetyltransferase complex protein AlgJ